MGKAHCRFNGQPLHHTFVDLGMSPLANSYLSAEHLNQAEKFYPLHAYVSEDTLLVQLEQFETPDHIFSDYAYFSSYSESWLRHAEAYTNLMVDTFGFNQSHQVVEIASNDGYLLQYFVQKGIPVLGIEPAANIAEVANPKAFPRSPSFSAFKLRKS
jgi:Putative zinc binding domain